MREKIKEDKKHEIKESDLSKDIQGLLTQRKKAREEKNWQTSDKIRDVLRNEHNVEVLDSDEGQRIEMIS